MQTQLAPEGLRSRTHSRRWVTVLAAMAAAVLAWTVADPLLGIDLLVDGGAGPAREVGQLAVCLTALAAGLAGWALLSVLERTTSRAHTVWRVLASATLVVSLAGPLAAVTAEATVTLVVLHVVVGAILVLGLPPAGGRDLSRPDAS